MAGGATAPGRGSASEIEMIVIAHAGHWALGLLEALPLFAVAAFALWRARQDRREGRRQERTSGVRSAPAR